MELSKFLEKVGEYAGGLVLRQQTTYVDVTVNSQTYRINYRGKREFLFASDRFDTISVHAKHPLLLDYLEPQVPVHLASAVDDKARLREVLEGAITEVFGRWRTLERYLNLPLESFLEKSYGLLMTAPETFAKFAAERAEEIAVRLILHKGHRDSGTPKVLVMDTNFVIADEFLVEALNPAEKVNA